MKFHHFDPYKDDADRRAEATAKEYELLKAKARAMTFVDKRTKLKRALELSRSTRGKRVKVSLAPIKLPSDNE